MPDAAHALVCGRLTRRAEFVAVAAGRRTHTARMTLQSLLRETDRPGMRVGLTITRKVGHATERNRIRRRLREAVKRAAPAWPQASLDLVIVARREALDAPFDLLISDLTHGVPRLLAPAKGAPNKGASRSPRNSSAARTMD